MKKVMLLVVGMFFAMSVSAATLTWDEGFNTDFTYSVPGSSIGASETYSEDGAVAHLDSLQFTVDVDTQVESIVSTFLGSQFVVNSVSLDGNFFTDLGAQGLSNAWALIGGAYLTAGIHSLVVDIASVSGAGQLNVQVSAVPIPAALFLFAPALLGFFGLRRKAAVAA